jgi:hypothetical protein
MTDFLFDRSTILEFEDRVTGEQFNITDQKIDFQVEKQISTEPNTANIDIYGLSDETAQKINFRKQILEVRYGKTIKIKAGYRDREKKIFQGVVIGANTIRDGVEKITRIEARNLWFELQAKQVKKTAAQGQPKADFIIGIIRDDIGAELPAESIKYITETLGNETFKDVTTYFGPARQVVDKISNNLLSKIIINFDDAGVNFQPIGIALDVPPLEYGPRTGLKGTPHPTETGLDFTVQLDNEARINRLVIVQSDTVRSLNDGGIYVIKKAIFAGVNRADGPWETRYESVFDLNPKGDFNFAFA